MSKNTKDNKSSSKGRAVEPDQDDDSGGGKPIQGTRGNDVLNGTARGEQIDGKAGNDIIYGNGGDDRLNGHDGDDVLNGGAGNDYIDGGAHDFDVAVFSGDYTDYRVVISGGGNGTDDEGFKITVTDLRPGSPDGTDVLRRVDALQFADRLVIIDGGRANQPPVANADSLTGTEDTVLTIPAARLLANDTDPEGNPLSLVSVQGAVGGTVVLSDGNVVFTPVLNFNGEAGFTYTVSDGNGGTATAKVTLLVAAVNDAPVAVNDAFSTNEDAPLVLSAASLLSNDTDVDTFDTKTLVSVQAASHGSVALLAGTVTFTPDANYNGAASFTYTMKDAAGVTSTATVNITVNPVNDAPVAVNDAFSTNEDVALVMSASSLVANDTDADTVDTKTVVSVQAPSHGSVSLLGGTVTFTPDANYNGAASFTYTMKDAAGVTSTATVNVTVNALNDAPVANADTLAATEDTPETYSAAQLLGNDTDVDSSASTLTIASVTGGPGGTAVRNEDGTVTFTPDLNFNGQASFSYTVSDSTLSSNAATATVNVGAVNDAPVANPDALAATEDTPVTYSAAQLLGNDTDIDSSASTLRIASVTSGQGGTAVLNNADATVTFTPDPDFTGEASFSYTVSDGTLISNAATVTVNVAAVDIAPVANPDTLAATEDTPETYSAAQLLGNDTDIDSSASTLRIASVTSGPGGTAVLNNADATVTFTPDADFTGEASFSYTVSDGTLSSNAATVTVNVSAVNDAPVANPDTLAATEDTPETYSAAQLLGNDTDIDSSVSTLRIASVTSGPGGTAVLNNADGTVTFTPDLNFNGEASFSYTVSDGTLSSNAATVTVNLSAVNDAPVANPDTLAATEDTPVTYSAAQLLGNDTDIDSSASALIPSCFQDETNCGILVGWPDHDG